MNEAKNIKGTTVAENGADEGAVTNDSLNSKSASGAGPDELESLRRRAEERDQMVDLVQRTQAEFENYQKRNQREREQDRKYANRGLALDLLPAIDNLERAKTAAQQTEEKGPLVEGVGMVLDQLFSILKRHGVTPIEAQGLAFDPNVHQAVMKQPAKDTAPNTVVQVLEKGFMIHDRVLRPARVVVAVAPESA